jgi:hypothetical protein
MRLVEAASQGCKATAAQAAAPLPLPSPDFNPLTTSIASLGAALAWGSIIVAVIAILVTVISGFIVLNRAEKEARETAEKCATELANKWLFENAPGIIRKHVEFIQNTSIKQDGDGNAADDIGNAAG